MEIASSVPIFNEKDGKWEVPILNEHSQVVRDEIFDTEEDAYAYITKHDRERSVEVSGKKGVMKIDKPAKRKTEKEILEEQRLALEGMLSTEGMPTESQLPTNNFKTPEEIAAEKAEFKESFEAEEKSCKDKAKSLLLQIAKVYLDSRIVSSNEYLKFKMKVEEGTLSTLLFQLKTSRRAIFKLSEEIHLGNTSARMFEVLSGLQRVVLDISKFQHEYIQSLEKSMKVFQEDMSTSPGVGNLNTLPQPETVDGTVVLIETSDKKTLLKEIAEFITQSKDKGESTTPRSKNTKLHDDDPDVEEIKDIEYKSESESDDSSSGLKGFEDDDDDS